MKLQILTAALLFSTAWATPAAVAPDFIAEDEDYAEDPARLDDGLFRILLEIESTMYKAKDDQLFQYRLVTLLPLIMERGNPDLTLPETKGNTALHYACALGNIELVQWLIDHGANTKARTRRGASVRDCVGRVNRKAIHRLLDEAHAKPETTRPEDGLAPENARRKTFCFRCEAQEVIRPTEIRNAETYDFLQPDSDRNTYEISWRKRNAETVETETACISSVYEKTGRDTATITHEYNSAESWYTRTFELQFTSPTSGSATCTVTGQPTTIWAEKIIYTGSFTLENSN